MDKQFSDKVKMNKYNYNMNAEVVAKELGDNEPAVDYKSMDQNW